MKTNKEILMIFNSVIIIAVLAIVLTDSSYAATDFSGPRGETEYARVTGIEENYIMTTENRFAVTKDTKIHNESGKVIAYTDIKKFSMVRILFLRVNGQLTAVDIILKETGLKKQPE